jgi:uncharacterized protein YciI
MLHAVTLYYLCPEETLSTQLDGHKQWLINGFNAGTIIFAGPLGSGTGGYILFNSEDVDSVTNWLEEDPFVIHKMVSVNVLTILPALRATAFPAQWAEHAKAF